MSVLGWRCVDPSAVYPDARWRARTARFEFQILFHPLMPARFHLNWLNRGDDGDPTSRRYWVGNAWTSTLEEAKASAEEWLADPNASPWN